MYRRAPANSVDRGYRGRHRRFGPGTMATIVLVVLAPMAAATIAAAPTASAVTVSPGSTPAFAGDAGDPDVVYSAGTYFAFTTGTLLGNHIQVLVSGSPSGEYRSYTGTDDGSTALANPPGWETINTQTSP